MPLSSVKVESPTAPERVEAVPGAERGLVLVVEDEAILRKMAQTMLNVLGYETLSAADGVEALEIFRDKGSKIQCVLLDLTMPRMGGWETLQALRKMAPGLPVVLASGYDEAHVMSADYPERPQVFLHKPYRMADLESAIVAAQRGYRALDALTLDKRVHLVAAMRAAMRGPSPTGRQSARHHRAECARGRRACAGMAGGNQRAGGAATAWLDTRQPESGRPRGD